MEKITEIDNNINLIENKINNFDNSINKLEFCNEINNDIDKQIDNIKKITYNIPECDTNISDEEFIKLYNEINDLENSLEINNSSENEKIYKIYIDTLNLLSEKISKCKKYLKSKNMNIKYES